MPITAPESISVSPAALIDHTLLRPETTEGQIELLCEEAVEFGFASVCVPPRFVPVASKLLYGSDVSVGTVIGFPLGYTTTASKVQEAEEARSLGAVELDMVIPVGAALSGDFDAVEQDIASVVRASEGGVVKVIFETALIPLPMIRGLVEVSIRAGAGYVKTSTGFGSCGATVEGVGEMVAASSGRIRVKASGGIRTLDDLIRFRNLGASRIGTSAGVSIMTEWLKRKA